MKKIIALILALIMTFSMGTVAFAEGTVADDTTAGETAPDANEGGEGEAEAEEEGDFDWLLDLPFWTVKPAAKIAKILLKFVKVFVKIGLAFGLIDANDIIGQIENLINGTVNGDAPAEEAPEVPAEPVALLI